MFQQGNASVQPTMNNNFNSNGQAMATSVNAEPVNTLPLGTLIDFMIHKTYHEIIVMAELLPSKTDMERKIELAQFTHRTRQSYIRLLALVKWASSVGKVTKCTEITTFLDQQSLLFVDTADKLHTLAHQLVVQARLPNFSVPAAIDVLTTGSYPRLPKCLRDKIVPPDPITSDEKNATLKRLNQIIMYNLVTTDIPPQFNELTVKNGMVHLCVHGEFEVFLTLMGDETNDPWVLLKLKFLVKDRETGGGKKLVHDMQIDYLHKLVQSRLIGIEKPLRDMYNLLHSFCLSLQLEVLQAQAVRLVAERWGRLIQIDEYVPGHKITLSYWKWNKHSTSHKPMQVSIAQYSKNDNRVLKVTHNPQLSMENIKLVEKALKVQNLSLEQLLNDTIAVRSYQILFNIKEIIHKHIKNINCSLNENKSLLVISLLNFSSSASENLSLSVDPHTGMCIPVVNGCSSEVLDEIEKSINISHNNVLKWISKLRVKLALSECKSFLHCNKSCCVVNEPLLVDKKSHPVMNKLSEELLYIKLTKFQNFYVVVELIDEKDFCIKFNYYLLNTLPAKKSTTINANSLGMFSTIVGFMQIFLPTENPETFLGLSAVPKQNISKIDIINVISICCARIPFIKLLEELSAEEFVHQGITEEGNDAGLCVKVISFPKADGISTIVRKNLRNSLLECNFRHALGDEKSWKVELVFCKRPFSTEKQTSEITKLVLNLDSVVVKSQPDISPVKKFMQVWNGIAKLHGPTVQLAEILKNPQNELSNFISVYSYNYNVLILKYGFSQTKNLMVHIKWSGGDLNKFVLHFGKCAAIDCSAQIFTSHYLANILNTNKDIGKVMKILYDTIDPIQAIYLLPVIPVIGLSRENLRNVEMNFTVLAQSATHFRLTFRETYALDVFCLPNKHISVRDGSLSHYDSTQVKESLIPIPGLHAFLSNFDDKSEINKRATVERDDPPSPDQLQTSTKEMKKISKGIWSGSSPMVLSCVAFSKILKPLNIVKPGNMYNASYLEMFLGYNLVLRTIKHEIRKSEELFYQIPPGVIQKDGSDSPLAVSFACHSLHFVFRMAFYQNMLHLNVMINDVPGNILQERGEASFTFQIDELKLLEKYFQLKVASPPFRPAAVKSFLTIISSPTFVLRNFIHIMRMELTNMGDANTKWSPRLCLTVPPRLRFFQTPPQKLAFLINPGSSAVFSIKDRVIIFCLLVPRQMHMHMQQPPLQPVALPIIWIPRLNSFSTFSSNGNVTMTPIALKLTSILKNLTERKNQEINLVNAIHCLCEQF